MNLITKIALTVHEKCTLEMIMRQGEDVRTAHTQRLEA